MFSAKPGNKPRVCGFFYKGGSLAQTVRIQAAVQPKPDMPRGAGVLSRYLHDLAGSGARSGPKARAAPFPVYARIALTGGGGDPAPPRVGTMGGAPTVEDTRPL